VLISVALVQFNDEIGPVKSKRAEWIIMAVVDLRQLFASGQGRSALDVGAEFEA